MKKPINTVVLALIFFLLTTSMATAHATLIAFDWTGEASSDGWSGTGELVIDDQDFGRSLRRTDIVSYAFSWTNGIDTYVATPGTSQIDDNRDYLDVNASGVITRWDLCLASVAPFECNVRDHPVLVIFGNRYQDFWSITTNSRGQTSQRATNTFSTGRAASPIPLPGTLTLLGAGFLALSIRRRQAQAIKPAK